MNTSIPISIHATGLVMEFVDQAFKIWSLLSVSGHEEEEGGVGVGHYYTPHGRSHHTEVREIWWDQTEVHSAYSYSLESGLRTF